MFRCRVWNEVAEGEPWSAFYHKEDKQCRSELTSKLVDLSQFALDAAAVGCESCTQSMFNEIYRHMNGVSVQEKPSPPQEHDPMMSSECGLLLMFMFMLQPNNCSWRPTRWR